MPRPALIDESNNNSLRYVVKIREKPVLAFVGSVIDGHYVLSRDDYDHKGMVCNHSAFGVSHTPREAADRLKGYLRLSIFGNALKEEIERMSFPK